MADIPHFTLNNGTTIPSVGLGTWNGQPGSVDVNGRDMRTSLKAAIEEHGYRHIDTASMYQDETEVGEAVRASNVPREEIYVTTKLSFKTRDDAGAVHHAFKDSMDKLNIGYIDAWLMHWPQGISTKTGKAFGHKGQDGPTFNETWAEMEKIHGEGKVKSIGVSNFSIQNLEILLQTAKIVPAINQVEGHPYHPDEALAKYCKDKGIHVTYYSPIGQPQNRTDILQDPELAAIAKETSSTPAQVALSWAVQKGRSVVPKSTRPERLQQNITLINLSAEQIARIDRIHLDDPRKYTRLNVAAADGKGKNVFGWSLEQLGWDCGFLPLAFPGKGNKVDRIA